MSKTGIPYLDEVWNPLVGCTPVSPGCRECWARGLHNKRHEAWRAGRWPTAPAQYHESFEHLQCLESRLADPLGWKRPRKAAGVCFESDLFHKDVTDAFLVMAFAIMANAKHHRFFIPTKRAQRMYAFLTRLRWRVGFGFVELGGRPQLLALLPYLEGDDEYWERIEKNRPPQKPHELPGFVAPNIWPGATICTQAEADRDLPVLQETPAARRWVSLEPMIEEIDIGPWIPCQRGGPEKCFASRPLPPTCCECSHGRAQVDLVIAGCESGKHRRYAKTDWFRSLRDQCAAAGVPFYLKQMEIEGRVVECPQLDGVRYDKMPEVRA